MFVLSSDALKVVVSIVRIRDESQKFPVAPNHSVWGYVNENINNLEWKRMSLVGQKCLLDAMNCHMQKNIPPLDEWCTFVYFIIVEFVFADFLLVPQRSEK